MRGIADYPDGRSMPKSPHDDTPQQSADDRHQDGLAGGAFLAIDVRRLFHWLRSGLVTILVAGAIGFVLAVAYGVLTEARYTATTELIVDPANLQIVPDDLYAVDRPSEVPLLNVDSKLRVLTSQNVMARVVERLDLGSDPEFVEPPSLFSLSTWLPGGGAERDPALIARAVLAERVSASRDERSFAVTVSVWSEDADKAVRLADAVVEAFQQELADAEAASAARAAEALVDRLSELRDEVTAAEDAVEIFRQENNLLQTEGELLSTRSMSEFNARIIEAQTQLNEAETRYNTLSSAANDPQASSTVLQSSTIAALKQQYAVLAQQAAAQDRIYGPRHPNRIALEPQMQQIEAEIARETERIVSAARKEMEQARANLASIRADAANAETVVDEDSEAQVRLRELQRDATAKAAVYEAFLSRARQVSERQQIDSTNIRVISPAVVPADRSWPPRTSHLAAAGLIAGFAFGALIVIGRGVVREIDPDWAAPSPQAARTEPEPEPQDEAAPATAMVSAAPEPMPRPAYAELATPAEPRAAFQPSDDRGAATARPVSYPRHTPRRRGGSLLDYI